MLSDLLEYGLRTAPGLALFGVCYALVRRDRDPLLRIAVLILGFVLLRDAMTPLGFWRFGVTDGGAAWLRFTDDWRVLAVFAASTLALTAAVLRLDPGLRSLVRWGTPDPATLAWGAAGGVLAAGPVLLLATLQPLHERGGEVAATLLPMLLVFALAGNLLEEVLFRGFLQGRLDETFGATRAALLSGLLFAACHSFLASTVTDVGASLLLFTLYEGLICAFLRNRRGVIASTVAHGLAIFLLAGALV
ncbi:hypothetical protein GCM10023085_08680 [Actinomadura viridis]|uniref:Membrane protease YdiL (CAAX protease family) n=1 Tax=Actinomadura viridis TaxID=58110 RepID=A0A931GTD2_9ACTN|nr:CPBP family intramembrane glutamic endopeptidase [Actinomadura viridis]MBG6091879.1 membrane protease YdiL (CAAX protease family) [Actinomadura viridis]